MIYVVRHGERGDDAIDPTEKEKMIAEYDPHLTKLGFLQAQAAGKEILRFTDDFTAKANLKTKDLKYIVVSSPFLRCIQTAANIVNSIGLDKIYNGKIYLESGASEIMSKKWFKETINEDLLIKKLNKEELTTMIGAEYTWGLGPEKVIVQPQYPEDFQQFCDRFETFYNAVKDWFLETFPSEEYALIIVTHGYGVQCVVELNTEFDLTKGTDFTCISGFYYPDAKATREKPITFVQQHAEHITKVKITESK